MNLKMKFACLLMLFFSVTAISQEAFLLNGTVTSQGDNQPVPGANVVVLNSTNGTSTDFDGNYQLNVKSGDVLQFSSLGFTSQTVIVANQQTINVSLVVDANQLDEVVVIGYGSQKKSHLTGAISKVVNDDLDQIAVSRVDEALIGQVSGVNIQATNAEAGGAPTITIRGVGSVNANSGPALVVDGIVVDSEFLGNIDMNDVESFEVLKDAASAAIYGSEGSNGVIMITTKSGKEGPTKYSYQTYIGVKEAHGSDDYRKSVKDWAATELAATGSLSEETQYMQLLVATTGIDRDWQDVFFDGGITQSHSFAARGGSKSTKFSASLKAIHDEGVVITDDYKSYTASLKLDTQLNDNLKFGIRATPSYTKQRRLPTSIHNPIRQSPWLPIYHTAETLQFVEGIGVPGSQYENVGIGDYFFENHLVELDFDGNGSDTRPRTSGDSNPYQQYVEREHYDLNTKLNSSMYLNYKITENLTAKSSLGLTLENRKRTRWDGTNYHANGASRAQYTVGDRNRTKVINDNTLLFNKIIGDKHEVSALAGFTIQKRTSEETITVGNGYSNDLLPNLNGATGIASYIDINLEQTKLSYFGRVSYAFDNKYLVNASIRRDGSSVFGLNTKYGNFPAASIGWNAHNEDFLSDSDVVSKLKFRVSYGLTGNDNFRILGGSPEGNVWPYLSLLDPTNAVSDGALVAGFSPDNIANLDLQWEANEEFNPAVDFGFFNNKITGSIDYYRRTSDKLLLDNPVSYVTGFQGGIVNLGEVENKGWEFELRTKNISKEKFSWSSTIIASTNKNELLSFGDSNNALLEDTYGRNSQWINRIGEPLSSFWGYVVDETYDDTEFRTTYVDTPWNRINGQADDTIVKDLNGDGLITDEDKTILGDPYPDLVYSFTNDFKFGSFDLSVMVQGSLGAQVNNIGDQYFFNWFGNRTRSGGEAQAVADGLVTHESFIQEKVLTSEVIASADYFSLRNVRFGYNMPDDYTSKLGVTGLRIYAAAQNLIYITADDYHGFNPEHVDGSDPRRYGSQRAGTPIFKTVSLGINIDF